MIPTSANNIPIPSNISVSPPANSNAINQDLLNNIREQDEISHRPIFQNADQFHKIFRELNICDEKAEPLPGRDSPSLIELKFNQTNKHLFNDVAQFLNGGYYSHYRREFILHINLLIKEMEKKKSTISDILIVGSWFKKRLFPILDQLLYSAYPELRTPEVHQLIETQSKWTIEPNDIDLQIINNEFSQYGVSAAVEDILNDFEIKHFSDKTTSNHIKILKRKQVLSPGKKELYAILAIKFASTVLDLIFKNNDIHQDLSIPKSLTIGDGWYLSVIDAVQKDAVQKNVKNITLKVGCNDHPLNTAIIAHYTKAWKLSTKHPNYEHFIRHILNNTGERSLEQNLEKKVLAGTVHELSKQKFHERLLKRSEDKRPSHCTETPEPYLESNKLYFHDLLQSHIVHKSNPSETFFRLIKACVSLSRENLLSNNDMHFIWKGFKDKNLLNVKESSFESLVTEALTCENYLPFSQFSALMSLIGWIYLPEQLTYHDENAVIEVNNCLFKADINNCLEHLLTVEDTIWLDNIHLAFCTQFKLNHASLSSPLIPYLNALRINEKSLFCNIEALIYHKSGFCVYLASLLSLSFYPSNPQLFELALLHFPTAASSVSYNQNPSFLDRLLSQIEINYSCIQQWDKNKHTSIDLWSQTILKTSSAALLAPLIYRHLKMGCAITATIELAIALCQYNPLIALKVYNTAINFSTDLKINFFLALTNALISPELSNKCLIQTIELEKLYLIAEELIEIENLPFIQNESEHKLFKNAIEKLFLLLDKDQYNRSTTLYRRLGMILILNACKKNYIAIASDKWLTLLTKAANQDPLNSLWYLSFIQKLAEQQQIAIETNAFENAISNGLDKLGYEALSNELQSYLPIHSHPYELGTHSYFTKYLSVLKFLWNESVNAFWTTCANREELKIQSNIQSLSMILDAISLKNPASRCELLSVFLKKIINAPQNEIIEYSLLAQINTSLIPLHDTFNYLKANKNEHRIILQYFIDYLAYTTSQLYQETLSIQKTFLETILKKAKKASEQFLSQDKIIQIIMSLYGQDVITAAQLENCLYADYFEQLNVKDLSPTFATISSQLENCKNQTELEIVFKQITFLIKTCPVLNSEKKMLEIAELFLSKHLCHLSLEKANILLLLKGASKEKSSQFIIHASRLLTNETCKEKESLSLNLELILHYFPDSDLYWSSFWNAFASVNSHRALFLKAWPAFADVFFKQKTSKTSPQLCMAFGSAAICFERYENPFTNGLVLKLEEITSIFFPEEPNFLEKSEEQLSLLYSVSAIIKNSLSKAFAEANINQINQITDESHRFFANLQKLKDSQLSKISKNEVTGTVASSIESFLFDVHLHTLGLYLNNLEKKILSNKMIFNHIILLLSILQMRQLHEIKNCRQLIVKHANALDLFEKRISEFLSHLIKNKQIIELEYLSKCIEAYTQSNLYSKNILNDMLNLSFLHKTPQDKESTIARLSLIFKIFKHFNSKLLNEINIDNQQKYIHFTQSIAPFFDYKISETRNYTLFYLNTFRKNEKLDPAMVPLAVTKILISAFKHYCDFIMTHQREHLEDDEDLFFLKLMIHHYFVDFPQDLLTLLDEIKKYQTTSSGSALKHTSISDIIINLAYDRSSIFIKTESIISLIPVLDRIIYLYPMETLSKESLNRIRELITGFSNIIGNRSNKNYRLAENKLYEYSCYLICLDETFNQKSINRFSKITIQFYASFFLSEIAPIKKVQLSILYRVINRLIESITPARFIYALFIMRFIKESGEYFDKQFEETLRKIIVHNNLVTPHCIKNNIVTNSLINIVTVPAAKNNANLLLNDYTSQLTTIILKNNEPHITNLLKDDVKNSEQIKYYLKQIHSLLKNNVIHLITKNDLNSKINTAQYLKKIGELIKHSFVDQNSQFYALFDLFLYMDFHYPSLITNKLTSCIDRKFLESKNAKLETLYFNKIIKILTLKELNETYTLLLRELNAFVLTPCSATKQSSSTRLDATAYIISHYLKYAEMYKNDDNFIDASKQILLFIKYSFEYNWFKFDAKLHTFVLSLLSLTTREVVNLFFFTQAIPILLQFEVCKNLQNLVEHKSAPLHLDFLMRTISWFNHSEKKVFTRNIISIFVQQLAIFATHEELNNPSNMSFMLLSSCAFNAQIGRTIREQKEFSSLINHFEVSSNEPLTLENRFFHALLNILNLLKDNNARSSELIDILSCLKSFSKEELNLLQQNIEITRALIYTLSEVISYQVLHDQKNTDLFNAIAAALISCQNQNWFKRVDSTFSALFTVVLTDIKHKLEAEDESRFEVLLRPVLSYCFLIDKHTPIKTINIAGISPPTIETLDLTIEMINYFYDLYYVNFTYNDNLCSQIRDLIIFFLRELKLNQFEAAERFHGYTISVIQQMDLLYPFKLYPELGDSVVFNTASKPGSTTKTTESTISDVLDKFIEITYPALNQENKIQASFEMLQFVLTAFNPSFILETSLQDDQIAKFCQILVKDQLFSELLGSDFEKLIKCLTNLYFDHPHSKEATLKYIYSILRCFESFRLNYHPSKDECLYEASLLKIFLQSQSRNKINRNETIIYFCEYALQTIEDSKQMWSINDKCSEFFSCINYCILFHLTQHFKTPNFNAASAGQYLLSTGNMALDDKITKILKQFDHPDVNLNNENQMLLKAFSLLKYNDQPLSDYNTNCYQFCDDILKSLSNSKSLWKDKTYYFLFTQLSLALIQIRNSKNSDPAHPMHKSAAVFLDLLEYGVKNGWVAFDLKSNGGIPGMLNRKLLLLFNEWITTVLESKNLKPRFKIIFIELLSADYPPTKRIDDNAPCRNEITETKKLILNYLLSDERSSNDISYCEIGKLLFIKLIFALKKYPTSFQRAYLRESCEEFRAISRLETSKSKNQEYLMQLSNRLYLELVLLETTTDNVKDKYELR